MIAWCALRQGILSALIAGSLVGVCQAEPMIGTVADMNGSEVGVRIEIPQSTELHSRLKSKLDVSRVQPCAAFGLRLDCYVASASLNEEFRIGYYGLNMLFAAPLPAVIYLVDRKTRNRSFEAVVARNIGKLPKLRLTLTDIDKKQSDLNWSHFREFADAMNWSYEDVDLVQNGRLSVQLLDLLATKGHKGDSCESGSPECAGLFRFKLQNGDTGHAYCAYNFLAGFRSAPYRCVAVRLKTGRAEYLAAFISPFVGVNYLPPDDAISCEIENIRGGSTDADRMLMIAKAIKESKIALDVKPVTVGRGLKYLIGQRSFEASRVLPDLYEHTMGAFQITSWPDTITIRGYVAPTLSDSSQKDRTIYLEPTEKQMSAYRGAAVADLSTGLSKVFGSKAECR